MTALAASSLSLAGPSQPPSQSSSPASPTASLAAQQAAVVKSVQAHLRNGSRPSTPVGTTNNAINGLAAAGPSLEPPTGMSFADFLETWDDKHVARWLVVLDPHGKCAVHAHSFRASDIRGGVLLELDQGILRDIGVNSVGDRIRILNAVKALRQRCNPRIAAANGIYGVNSRMQGSSVSSLASSGSGTGATTQSPKVTVNGAEHVDYPRARSPHAPQQQQLTAASQAQHARSRARPAPLQLQHNNQPGLPRLIRDQPQPPDSARAALGSGVPTTPVRPLPNPSSSVQATDKGTPGSGRQLLPPLPPPPRAPPPHPPTGSTSSRGQPPRLHALATHQAAAGRRTPTQTDAPPPPAYAPPPVPAQQGQGQSTPQALDQSPPSLLAPSNGGWKGEYGLPSGPRSGGAGRATSPLPSFGRRSPGGAHTKAPSYSAPSSSPVPGLKPSPRPSTTGGHPYASPSSSNGSLQPPQQAGGAGNQGLSPIAESFISQSSATPTTASPATAGTASSSSSVSGSASGYVPSSYHVGRGPFRPATPSGSSAAPSLAGKRLVRFLFPDENHGTVVDVAGCANGVEILELVLRKFGKLSSGQLNTDELVGSDDGGLSIDGWAVYRGSQDDGPARPLREAELLSLCSESSDQSVREYGLTIRRTGKPRRSKALQQIFGDGAPGSPHSPAGGLGEDDAAAAANTVQFPRALTPSQEKELKNMKRASSISVLSGLGVRDPERVLDGQRGLSPDMRNGERERDNNTGNVGGSAPGKSPSSTTFAGKIRTFLGARPPSELIATHLPAYFPYTQPKVLRRTVRQSMRFSNGSGAGRRDSAISVATLAQRRVSRRVSTASRPSSEHRSSTLSLPPPPVPEKGLSPDSHAHEDPPRMSLSTSDGHSVDIDIEEDEKRAEETPKDERPSSSSASTPLLLPPVNFPSESFADAFQSVTGSDSRPSSVATGGRSGATPPMSRAASNASRRFSYMNELRARRDRSDTASMLTVDEITAEVEQRRKSTVPSIKSFKLDGGETPEGAQTPLVEDDSEEIEDDEETFEIIEDDEELDEMEEEYDEETLGEEDGEDDEATLANEDEEGDPDAPVKSTGGKRGIKWIRGALIGAGSFGSVYLGMDAMNGLLMAVKQVELPTGTGPNEQRKKSMLDALEREIDLLRELQHENIVQYLDSSSDDKHLNIFLEYVPGGSVTALLHSYGAFEEALCRHFVRQILQGLNYLHERDIIHRDIKGANILVDNKGGIKISDFGISKKVEETILGSGARVHRPSLQGSVYWMAPEVVKQIAHTRKADIWSVGCLVVEMLTGNHPYPTLNQMQAIFKIGMSAKPSIPSDISSEAEDFLSKTFDINHENRPGADELLQHPWIVKGPSSASTTTSAKTTSAKSKGSKTS